MQLIVGQDPSRFQIATLTAAAPMVHFSVSGEVDLATAPTLLSTVLDAIRDHRPSVLELDLADVTFFDARGVSALILAARAARAAGCTGRLRRPRAHVRRILELTGLTSIWEIVD
jgi:anti-sigma B factor antagonist